MLHYIGFISVHVHTVARLTPIDVLTYTFAAAQMHIYIRDACIVSQLYGSPRKRLNGCVYLQANYLSIIIELYYCAGHN